MTWAEPALLLPLVFYPFYGILQQDMGSWFGFHDPCDSRVKIQGTTLPLCLDRKKTWSLLDYRSKCQNLVSALTCGHCVGKVESSCSRKGVSSNNQSNMSDKIIFKGDKLIVLSTDHQ